MKTFEQLIKETILVTQCQEKQVINTLSNHDGIATHWSTDHNGTNPGFFTPFNQKLYQNKTAGMKQAAIAAGLLPALHLQLAVTAALMSPAFLLSSIGAAVNGQWSEAQKNGMQALGAAGMGIYFSGAFVLNLLKEVTAFITRSIATLVDMCKGVVCKNVSNNPDDQIDSEATTIAQNVNFTPFVN